MVARNARLAVEALEPREVPAGFTASAAVQADVAQIHTDTQTFSSELQALAPTLQKDQQALTTAIKNATTNDASVAAAQATLNADLTTWLAQLRADVQAYQAAATDTARAAIVQQYTSDLTTAISTVGADVTAVHTAIEADPAVQAAQAQLTADAAPLYAQLAVIQADYAQLRKDIQAS